MFWFKRDRIDTLILSFNSLSMVWGVNPKSNRSLSPILLGRCYVKSMDPIGARPACHLLGNSSSFKTKVHCGFNLLDQITKFELVYGKAWRSFWTPKGYELQWHWTTRLNSSHKLRDSWLWVFVVFSFLLRLWNLTWQSLWSQPLTV